MAKEKKTVLVTQQERLCQDIYSIWLKAGSMAMEAGPGQFVSVYPKDGSRLLPRPLSICEIDREREELRIVYRVVGAGTQELSALKAGDTVDILGPLGNGFPKVSPEKTAVLMGGGIGIPPMLELARSLDCKKAAVLGYRDQLFLNQEFEPYSQVVIATEDGSAGTKGNVLDAVREQGITGDVIMACGPAPMLRAIKAYAAEHQMECYISLEEKMACGIGACLACVCQTKEVDHHSNVHNRRICKDGPVFAAEEVEL